MNDTKGPLIQDATIWDGIFWRMVSDYVIKHDLGDVASAPTEAGFKDACLIMAHLVSIAIQARREYLDETKVCEPNSSPNE